MPDDRKELIAAAARRLLLRRDGKKLTVTDIVNECHITRQTHKAARDTAGHVAEAAQNARCKALQADHIGHGGADIVQRHNQDADAAADHGTDGDGDRHIAVDVDADDRGRRAVLRHAAHGLAGLGLLQVELQQCNDDDRGDDKKQVGF